MKGIRNFIFLLVLISLISSPLLNAQPVPAEGQHFDMTGFPQWAVDLRRGNIITFGIFPFAYIFSNFLFDTYRFAANDWDRRFAPWPIPGSGGVGKTQGEMFATIGLAAGVAIITAIVDHGIVRARRNRLERERNLPEEGPIIIRRSMNGEEAGPPDADSPETVNP